jgi:mycothiol synthase
MRVEEIDARTAPDDVLLTFHAIELACWAETNGSESARSADEAVGYYRIQPTTHTSAYWLADGGFAKLYVHGPTAAFAHVLVLPERRRAGLGTALLAAVRDRCLELGVTALHARHASPSGAAFAAHVGAVDSQRDVYSSLELRSAPLPEPSVPSGWTLVNWLARVPDEHLAAYVVARGAMDDAPTPEAMEFPTWTAEQVRASEESLALREREMRLTVAMNPTGDIGAFTELRLSRGSTAGFTDDTGTVAEHRGQGLARAIKLESLRGLRNDHPEVEVVTTSNAEENVVMRHINESVGFRPIVTVTVTTLAL